MPCDLEIGHQVLRNSELGRWNQRWDMLIQRILSYNFTAGHTLYHTHNYLKFVQILTFLFFFGNFRFQLTCCCRIMRKLRKLHLVLQTADSRRTAGDGDGGVIRWIRSMSSTPTPPRHVLWSVNSTRLCLSERCQYTVRLRNWRLNCASVGGAASRERIGETNIICKQSIACSEEEKIFTCKLYGE